MPIPRPRRREQRDDFISRCMGDDVMVREYPDDKARYAVCQRSWDGKTHGFAILLERLQAYSYGVKGDSYTGETPRDESGRWEATGGEGGGGGGTSGGGEGGIVPSRRPAITEDELEQTAGDLERSPEHVKGFHRSIEERVGTEAALKAMASLDGWVIAWGDAPVEWAAAQSLGANHRIPERTRPLLARVSESDVMAVAARVAVTQEIAREKFGETVTLYRGVHGKQAGELRGSKKGDQVEMGVRGLASFTTDPKQAKVFGKGGVVVKFEVSTRDVFSLASTSAIANQPGYADDLINEVVVLNRWSLGKACEYDAPGAELYSPAGRGRRGSVARLPSPETEA